ncbi:anthranilate synthase component II [Marinobacterium sediminicola]|uniref:Anthranilate synthase component 2 n=1 Tax=Marinobacterium sediminicola TaxID=518898 RepID=A0ABY1S1R5_9GAMM|nr:aminodeoxychorismate/anthranilate synthase component II [Marinobacterium sediminicola]ULG69487.1 aminodeoxychorismate/anthranilate synthase component II [Marinobacterium sediminicola]SMR75637.1 anthranilate synthase component 2 [Marinobacterium sediminicola]
MKVYIIDNYDSFTYNLYQYIGEILSTEQHQGRLDSFDIVVKRNDEVTLADLRDAAPDRIIISPGPGSPDDPEYFGVCAEVIRELGPQIPLLGVCLGMQGIVHVFGGKVVKASLPMHGKISPISHTAEGVFANTPDQLEIMRYHSLMAEPESLPECLDVTAVVGDLPVASFTDHARIHQGGEFEIMGVKHREYPIHGIQFHPESFATEGGKELIANFLFQA